MIGQVVKLSRTSVVAGVVALLQLLLIVMNAQSQAPTKLSDVPAKCTIENPHYSVGPAWVRLCESVCDQRGEATDTWYSERICGGQQRNQIVYQRCEPDPVRKSCNRVVSLEEDPRNFDCSANAGGPWRCVLEPMPVRCGYPVREGSPQVRLYLSQVGRGYCRPKTAGLPKPAAPLQYLPERR